MHFPKDVFYPDHPGNLKRVRFSQLVWSTQYMVIPCHGGVSEASNATTTDQNIQGNAYLHDELFVTFHQFCEHQTDNQSELSW